MADTGNLKGFESPIDKLTPTNLGAESFEMEGRHVAAVYHQAGESFGGALKSIGEQIEQQDTVMQTADLMKNMSDLEIQKQQAFLNAKKTMDLNDPDAVSKFMGGFDEQLDAIKSKTYTPRAYDAMTRMTSDFNARTTNEFRGYQSNAQANEAIANFENAGNNYATILGQDPSQAKNVKDQIQLGAQNLEVEHRATLTLPVIQHALDAGAEVMTGKVEGAKIYDPKKVQDTIDYINDPRKNGYVADPKDPNSVGMSHAKYVEVMNRLNNAHRTGESQTIAGITLNSDAGMLAISRGGQEPPELNGMIDKLQAIAASGGSRAGEAEAEANKLIQQKLDAHAEYDVRQTTSQLPADKMTAYGNSLSEAVKKSQCISLRP